MLSADRIGDHETSVVGGERLGPSVVGAATEAGPRDMTAPIGRGGDRVQFFDLLRAFAIFVVIVGHYRSDVFPGGAIGVSVFFALSGYLITTILLNEPVLDLHSTWRFLVRRFLRVCPPYFVAAVAILLLAWLAIQVCDRMAPMLPQYSAEIGQLRSVTAARLSGFLDGFVQQMLFIRTPSWLGMGVGVFWTLQIEFWFYVTMPLVMLVAGRGRGLAAALVGMLALSLALRFVPASMMVWPISLVPPSSLFAHIAKWFDTLLCGALVAYLAHRRATQPVSDRQFRRTSVACLALLVLIVLFVSNADRALVWPLMATASGLIAAYWILIFVSSGAEPNYPFIAWFGRISYSVYLVHAIPLDFIGYFPWPLTGTFADGRSAAFLLASILAAAGLHYLVEKPSIRLGRYLTRRRQAARPAIPAPPDLGFGTLS